MKCTKCGGPVHCRVDISKGIPRHYWLCGPCNYSEDYDPFNPVPVPDPDHDAGPCTDPEVLNAAWAKYSRRVIDAYTIYLKQQTACTKVLNETVKAAWDEYKQATGAMV